MTNKKLSMEKLRKPTDQAVVVERKHIDYKDFKFRWIVLEKEKGIATLTLNNPEERNSFSPDMFHDINEASRLVAYDTDVRVLVVTGAGKAFCSGGNIKRFADTARRIKRGMTPEEWSYLRGLYLRGHERNPFFMLETMPKPVIAMVNGDAVGAGCNMMLHCDIAIASESARFSYGYTRIGLHSGGCGSFVWVSKVGIRNACELAFTARFITAQEAKEYGLVNRVVPADQLKTVTYELAQEIADGPPMTIALIKRGLYAALVGTPQSQDLYDSLAHFVTFTDEAHAEGLAAFTEKRKPAYQDSVPLHPYVTGIDEP